MSEARWKPLRKFLSHWPNKVGLGLVVFFIGVALAAPLIAPPVYHESGESYIREVRGQNGRLPQPPSSDAWLGTTSNRSDIFYWLVWGTRPTLIFGLKVSLISAVIGLLVGTFSGYWGGRAGAFLMRVTDGFLTFPVIAGYLLMTQIKVMAVQNLPNMGYVTSPEGVRELTSQAVSILSIDALFWALILLSWMPYARMLNAMISVHRSSQYVQAAEALGAGPLRVIFRHLLPNSISPAIVLMARDMGAVVILQASLAFAGFGGASPWGELLLWGRKYVIGPGGDVLRYWWVWIPATVLLVLFGVAWNLLGDGLSDALNPKTEYARTDE